eukprot:6641073-Pyramimonas_sp.AAC.1
MPAPGSFFEVVNEILLRRGLEMSITEHSDSRVLSECRERREDLLRRRRELRRQLSFTAEEEEEEVVEQMKEVTAAAHKERRKQWVNKQRMCLELLHDAWRGRRFAEAHQYSRLASGSSWGIKKRNYSHLQ